MRSLTILHSCLLAGALGVTACKRSGESEKADVQPPKKQPTPSVSGFAPKPPSGALAEWTERYQAIEDESERLDFISEMIATDDDEEFPARVGIALGDTSPIVRREAMAAVSSMDPQVSYPLLMRAITDSDDFVRDYALGDIRRLPDAMKIKAYREGLKSEHEDVKDKAIRSLANLRTPEAFGILLEGLSDESPEVREAINRQSNALVEKEFSSYAEAQAWWEANKSRYDERLLPLDD